MSGHVLPWTWCRDLTDLLWWQQIGRWKGCDPNITSLSCLVACWSANRRSDVKTSWKQITITPASDPKQCVGGQQQKIRYISLRQPPNTRHRDKSQENCLQDICLCLLYTSYLKILCRSHVSDSCRTGHQWGSATRSTSSDSCLNIFVSQAPLQDPCLWIHVSASMCISGSSARSMLPDS